jgi:hypothetical protein
VLDNNSLNLVTDIIEAINSIFQMLVDLTAANELHRILPFDFLIEQLKASIIGVVGIAFDARNLEADLVELCGVARNVG